MKRKRRPGAEAHPEAAAKPILRIVIFKNKDGERLSKKFSLVGDRLEKQSATFLSRGTYHTAHLPFDQGATHALDRLGELLQGLGPDQAIAIGHHKQGHESGTLASISKSREGDITRTLSNFAFSQGPGFILVDNDSGTGTVPILEALYPAFGQVACLTRPSSSSGLYDAGRGAPLSAGGGEHLYFVADDQSQHKAILHASQRLAWTKGYGRLELSRNGATLIRSPVDVSVGSPERLVYEGAPELEHPIAQHPRHCTVRPGGMLDTQAFLAYVDREAPQEMVDKLIGEAEADDAFQARKAKVRKEWELEYVAQRVAEGAEEIQARNEIQALQHRVLLGSAIFVTRSGAKITIGEILFDPGKYEGEVSPDPIEGRSYGSTTARVMAARAGGAPVIFSFAHGDMIYELKHDVRSIETGFESAFSAKGQLRPTQLRRCHGQRRDHRDRAHPPTEARSHFLPRRHQRPKGRYQDGEGCRSGGAETVGVPKGWAHRASGIP